MEKKELKIETDSEFEKTIKTLQEDLGNILLPIAIEIYTDKPELEARFNINKLEEVIREYANKKNSI